ncbi:condensation domain-containing protein [Streptomyces sp. SP18BB07]|uniref:condensation domain-containing protein n=1 Tax=Streptomyces sp. SP18BB07 TaxID=3002522 RepID=UPI002E79222C|nr:condensation domain-containing protein [Streptomyces sp. SP18BB07]MEE1757685.1 condensation domain-containing protein [Streptomyces sp. SP18BB07]
MTVRAEQLPVQVRGCRSRSGPLTYGQAYIWNSIRSQALEDQHNFHMNIALPPHSTPADVRHALSVLLSAHESLRATLRPEPSGPPSQVVAGDGELPLTVVESDHPGPAALAELRELVTGQGFDHYREWPIRVGVLCSGRRAHWLVLMLSHLASDASGARILRRHLLSVLDGAPDADGIDLSCRQPLEQAAHERSPDGARGARRALDYWRHQLQEVPVFDRPAVEPGQPRFWQGLLESPGLGRAAPALAERAGISTYSVLTAAVALVLGRLAGRDRYCLAVMCSNRHTPALRDSVMNLPQRVPLTVDLTGSFTDIARRAHTAALNGYRFGMYDPAAARALISSVGEQRGGVLDFATTFNALKPLWRDEEQAGRPPASASSFHWIRKTATDIERLRFADYFAPDRIALYADTSYYPLTEIESCLRDVERTVVQAEVA